METWRCDDSKQKCRRWKTMRKGIGWQKRERGSHHAEGKGGKEDSQSVASGVSWSPYSCVETVE